ncbi:MAG: hypothetical protein ACKOYN_05685 [Planctomycetota bacterium]
MSDGFNPCPRLESGDPRCEERLRLGNLDDVFRFCTADHSACPVFRGGGCGGGATERPRAGEAAHDGLCRFRSCDGTPSDDAVEGSPRLRLARGGFVGLTVRGARADGAQGLGGGATGLHRAAS